MLIQMPITKQISIIIAKLRMLIFTAKQDCMSQDLQKPVIGFPLLVATLTALALS